MITQKEKKYNIFKKQNNAEIIAKGLDTIPDNWSLTPKYGKGSVRPNWQKEDKLSKEVIANSILKGDDFINKQNKKYRAYATGFGIRLGNGIIAIDVDGVSAIDLLKAVDNYQLLPETVSFSSGRQGRQTRLYQIPTDYQENFSKFTTKAYTEINGVTAKEGQLLEFNYNGKTANLPPSLHPDTGKLYQWINSPKTHEIAQLPLFLINLLLQKEEKAMTTRPYEQYLKDLILPLSCQIPLEICLAPSTRDLLNGVDGNRNSTAAQIARDILGTSRYLESLGQAFYPSDWTDLMYEFWQRCSQNPPFPIAEIKAVIKSAEKDNPNPCLDIDKIHDCIGAWYWKNSDIKEVYYGAKNINKPHATNSTKPSHSQGLGLTHALLKAEDLIIKIVDEIELNVALEDIRQQLEKPISEYQWDKKYITPLKRKLKASRAKLDIQLYLQEEDIFKQVQLKKQIQETYGYSNSDFYALVNHVEDSLTTPEKTDWTVDELIALVQNKVNWLIPSFLPVGELLLISALSKVGKSLLTTEITYNILKGGTFLGEPVQQGKVLYVFPDESDKSLGRRLHNLGFDLLPNRQTHFSAISRFDIRNLRPLERKIQEFKPSLIVLDSLTAISQRVGISENDAQFARYIHALKDLLAKHNVSGILIHHDGKSNEHQGMNKIAGSSRIPSACWGTAQLMMSDGTKVNEDEEGNETTEFSENFRFLTLNNTRDTEKTTWKLCLNHYDFWIENGIYEFMGETDDPRGEKRQLGEQIIALLEATGKRLEGFEILNYLGCKRDTLYKTLSRLERRGDIVRDRSTVDNRKWVYFIATDSQDSNCKDSLIVTENTLTPPLPSQCDPKNKKIDETIMDKELEVSGQDSKKVWTVSGHLTDDEETVQCHQNETEQTIEPIIGQVDSLDTPPLSEDVSISENDDDTNCNSTQVIECPSDFKEIFKQNTDRLIAMGKDTLPKRMQWYQSFWGVNISSPKDFYNQSLVTDEMIIRSWHELRLLEIKNQ